MDVRKFGIFAHRVETLTRGRLSSWIDRRPMWGDVLDVTSNGYSEVRMYRASRKNVDAKSFELLGK